MDRRQIKDTIALSRGERNGIIALVVLALIIIIVPGVLMERYDKRNFEQQLLKDSLVMAQLDMECDSVKTISLSYNGKPSTSDYTIASDRNINTIYEINTSSMEKLQELPGIGQVLSERIIKYRDKLGGFYSAGQVAEVYGLSRETYEMISKRLKCNEQVTKISVNQASYDRLAAHPYISPKLAAQIVSYRSKVKSYSKLEDMRALYLMTDSTYDKLLPYLEL